MLLPLGWRPQCQSGALALRVAAAVSESCVSGTSCVVLCVQDGGGSDSRVHGASSEALDVREPRVYGADSEALDVRESACEAQGGVFALRVAAAVKTHSTITTPRLRSGAAG